MGLECRSRGCVVESAQASSHRNCLARLLAKTPLPRLGAFAPRLGSARGWELPQGGGNAGEGVCARDRGRRVGLARLTRRGRASIGTGERRGPSKNSECVFAGIWRWRRGCEETRYGREWRG